MKYAVFEHGGKQFVASEGQLIEVDRLAEQAGASVEFGQVLLLRENDQVEVGSPYIRGARVKARVAAHVKGPKLLVFKYRPKQRYRVRQGHRQGLTQVEIESIGQKGAAPPARAETTAEPEAEVAARKPAPPVAKPRAPRAAAAAKKAGQTARPSVKPTPKPKPKPKAQASKSGPKPKRAGKGKTAKKPAPGQKKSGGSKT